MKRSCLAALIALLALCPPPAGAPRADTPRRPNVIVIVVDALRADFLGCYGFPGPISPAIDAFAKESLVFERCATAAPWTKPSVASLFTSLYPAVHGVVNPRWPPRPDAPLETEVLAPEAVTMAEQFRKNGYATVAYFANDWLKDPFGFSQGFEEYRYFSRSRLLSRVSDWIRGYRETAPFFMYVHAMEVHGPFEYEAAVFETLKPTLTAGDRELTNEEMEGLSSYLKEPFKNGVVPRSLSYWRTAYAGGVRRFDDEFDKFIRGLRENGQLDNTLVILTSDHGEGLMEHGYMEHGNTLHIEEVQIPFILRLPGAPNGRRLPGWISLMDVLPTLSGLCGFAPNPSWQGRDISRFLAKGSPPAGMPFSSAVKKKPKLKSLLDGKNHLISDIGKKTSQLYNLETDPKERNDRAAAAPKTRTALEVRLGQVLKMLSGIKPLTQIRAPVSDEMRDNLRSLGYLQ